MWVDTRPQTSIFTLFWEYVTIHNTSASLWACMWVDTRPQTSTFTVFWEYVTIYNTTASRIEKER
jgi:hypothetical protein